MHLRREGYSPDRQKGKGGGHQAQYLLGSLQRGYASRGVHARVLPSKKDEEDEADGEIDDDGDESRAELGERRALVAVDLAQGTAVIRVFAA